MSERHLKPPLFVLMVGRSSGFGQLINQSRAPHAPAEALQLYTAEFKGHVRRRVLLLFPPARGAGAPVSNTREEVFMSSNPTPSTPEPDSAAKAYWNANLRLIAGCLAIWALVSYGFSILLRPLLAGIPVGGTDLGFWFAQQGSIITFIALIFFYAWRMNRLDKKFGLDEE